MSAPLAAFPLARTQDPDEAQSVLSREVSELRFRSVRNRQQFQFEMNGVRLGRTTLAFNRFSTESEVDAGVVQNSVIASICIGPPTALQLDGEWVGADRLGIVSPARHTTVYRTAGSGVLMLRADRKAIEQRFREWTGDELSKPILFQRSAVLKQGVGAQIRRIWTYLLDDARSADTILNNPILRAAFDDLILNTILTLPSNCVDALGGPCHVTAAPRLVQRAEQFLEAHAAEPITISDVIAECGCSRRTLFQAFRRHRGYTPLQFLADTRLITARDALHCPGPNDTVTSIALRCGFPHLGRFAEAYYRRFGEKPSETFRRA